MRRDKITAIVNIWHGLAFLQTVWYEYGVTIVTAGGKRRIFSMSPPLLPGGLKSILVSFHNHDRRCTHGDLASKCRCVRHARRPGIAGPHHLVGLGAFRGLEGHADRG